MPERTLGQQLTDSLAFEGGTVTVHENGFALAGEGVSATGWWGFLGIGRPVIVSGDPASSMGLHLRGRRRGAGGLAGGESLGWCAAPSRTGSCWRRTAVGGTPVELVVAPAEDGPGGRIVVPVTAPAMAERVLYDVAVSAGPTVAPHAVYFRREWRDFGLAHITDTHVARRIDQFRQFMVDAGRPESAAAMVNFNDRFRGFVKYANRLHEQGVLDVIVVTGDLYDYIHENLLEPGPNMNPELLRDLILGRSDGPDFADIEELRVPIFLTPGNHDYRIQPYHLVCDLKSPIAGTDTERGSPAYDGYRLGETDAAIITNRLYPKKSGTCWSRRSAGQRQGGAERLREPWRRHGGRRPFAARLPPLARRPDQPHGGAR